MGYAVVPVSDILAIPIVKMSRIVKIRFIVAILHIKTLQIWN